jgi:hypothetical protein
MAPGAQLRFRASIIARSGDSQVVEGTGGERAAGHGHPLLRPPCLARGLPRQYPNETINEACVTMPQYKRPPITEAVIELRLEQPLSGMQVEKLAQRFRSEYAFSEDFLSYEVHVNAAARSAEFQEQSSGYKLSSKDRADILLVTSAHMTCARLAP